MDIQRRTVIQGLGGLPFAAILADPARARAAAAGLETVAIATDGGRKASAALALPAAQQAPAVLLIHEWWGLNDQIKAAAAEFAKAGYVALAVDLYGGRVAATPDEARALSRGTDADQATDILRSWIGWLRAHARGNGKVGTVGWCYGGGWSLRASLAAPVDATVIYYGRVPSDADALAALKGPVMGHFGKRDRFIDADMVNPFAGAMRQAGKSIEIYWYDADHAFANPTGGRYDRADAKVAWERTMGFLAAHLGG